jgi:hypothetical protein
MSNDNGAPAWSDELAEQSYPEGSNDNPEPEAPTEPPADPEPAEPEPATAAPV